MFGTNNDKEQFNTDDISAPLPPDEPIADNTLSNDNDGSTTVINPTDNDNVSNYGSAVGDPTPPPGTSLVSSGMMTQASDSEEDFTKQPIRSINDTVVVGQTGDDLLSIKQQALQQLGPLVSHLDQTPEEKFRTTMMMIQANDDRSLVKDAYETAKQITDDKGRAQALLDVINEINYFTQKSEE